MSQTCCDSRIGKALTKLTEFLMKIIGKLGFISTCKCLIPRHTRIKLRKNDDNYAPLKIYG